MMDTNLYYPVQQQHSCTHHHDVLQICVIIMIGTAYSNYESADGCLSRMRMMIQIGSIMRVNMVSIMMVRIIDGVDWIDHE